MYRQTTYGEFYSQPERPPRIRWDKIFNVLFAPVETFREIYHDTTKMQGIIVTTFFTILSVALSLFFYSTFGFYETGMGVSDNDSGFLWFFIIITAITIPLAIVGLYLSGYFSAMIAGGMGGFKNPDKTIGLVGYGVIVSFIMGTIQLSVLSVVTDPNPEVYDSSYGASIGIAIVFGIISFIWSLWVNGSAVSVANDVSLGKGVLSYFLGLILTWIVIAVISFMIAMILIFALIASF